MFFRVAEAGRSFVKPRASKSGGTYFCVGARFRTRLYIARSVRACGVSGDGDE